MGNSFTWKKGKNDGNGSPGETRGGPGAVIYTSTRVWVHRRNVRWDKGRRPCPWYSKDWTQGLKEFPRGRKRIGRPGRDCTGRSRDGEGKRSWVTGTDVVLGTKLIVVFVKGVVLYWNRRRVET